MRYRKKAEARLRALAAMERSMYAPVHHPNQPTVSQMYDGMRKQFQRRLKRDRKILNDTGLRLAQWALRAMESEGAA